MEKTPQELNATLKDQVQTRTAALEQLVTERTAELQKGNQALTALYEVSRGLVTALDLKSLLPIIAQQIGDTSGADCYTVFLFDEETEVLRARCPRLLGRAVG